MTRSENQPGKINHSNCDAWRRAENECLIVAESLRRFVALRPISGAIGRLLFDVGVPGSVALRDATTRD
mgnify:CR=1 FL=1